MPTVMSRNEVQAFAHCTNIFCPGHDQVPVTAIRQELGYTYLENGGDLPFVEKSTVSLEFANPDDVQCPSCERVRELSDQPRVDYENLSGHDPRGLVGIKYRSDGSEREDGEYLQEQNEERFKALEEQNAALIARLEAMSPPVVDGED